MNIIPGLIGGVIGGLIGAAIWVAVGYSTGYEVGWIAIGIGALVGAGVSAGMKGEGGIAGGGTAAILAVGSVLLGKWAVVYFLVGSFTQPDDMAISAIADVMIAERVEAGGRPAPVLYPENPDSIADFYRPGDWSAAEERFRMLSADEQQELRELPALANPDIVLSFMADSIVEEYMVEGRAVDWPPGADPEMPWRQADYPPEIWSDAVSRWEAMSGSEQMEYEESVKGYLRVQMAGMQEMMTNEGFFASFALWDLLWMVLAVGTAAKLGAGGAGAET